MGHVVVGGEQLDLGSEGGMEGGREGVMVVSRIWAISHFAQSMT